MANIPLKSMTIEEKLQAMEALWVDICANAEFQPPNWHRAVVRAREDSVGRGDQGVDDWEDAKKRILEELR